MQSRMFYKYLERAVRRAEAGEGKRRAAKRKVSEAIEICQDWDQSRM